MRVCSLCEQSLPANIFYGTRCKPCRNEVVREQLYSNPERLEKVRESYRGKYNPDKYDFEAYRANHLKYNYGLTPEQYEKMLEEQNGTCAICKMPETWTHKKTGKVASLSVDHDHETGKIRGLLCRDCNQSIGKFKDNAKLLYAAYEYLSIHKMEENI